MKRKRNIGIYGTNENNTKVMLNLEALLQSYHDKKAKPNNNVER